MAGNDINRQRLADILAEAAELLAQNNDLKYTLAADPLVAGIMRDYPKGAEQQYIWEIKAGHRPAWNKQPVRSTETPPAFLKRVYGDCLNDRRFSLTVLSELDRPLCRAYEKWIKLPEHAKNDLHIPLRSHSERTSSPTRLTASWERPIDDWRLPTSEKHKRPERQDTVSPGNTYLTRQV